MTEEQFFKMLGKRLTLFRKQSNMTQTDLARATGLPQPNISRFEKGNGGIKGVHRIKKLVEATGHSMEDLFVK